MYCIKCGKDTKSECIFCDSCLDSMEKYPVKPGTPISLPVRQPLAPIKKTQTRRKLELEEKVLHQKRSIRLWVLILFLTTVLLGLSIYLIIWLLQGNALPFQHLIP